MLPDWHFFDHIFTGIITPLIQALQGRVDGVVGAVRPAALVLTIVFVAVSGIDIALQRKSIDHFLRDAIIAAFLLGFIVSGASYMQYVGDLFLTAIPNSITQAIAGTAASPAAGIDKVANAAAKAALTAYNALPWALMSIPLAGAIIVFGLVAFGACGYTFGIFVTATITTVIAVFIGPIFVALAIVPATRKYANGWLGVLAGSVTAQLVALAVLTLATAAVDNTLVATANTIKVGDNSASMLVGLAQCGVLLWLFKDIIKGSPALAYRIAGGVYATAGRFQAVANAPAAIGSAASTVVSAAAPGAGRVAAVALRSAAATGASLSRRI